MPVALLPWSEARLEGSTWRAHPLPCSRDWIRHGPELEQVEFMAPPADLLWRDMIPYLPRLRWLQLLVPDIGRDLPVHIAVYGMPATSPGERTVNPRDLVLAQLRRISRRQDPEHLVRAAIPTD